LEFKRKKKESLCEFRRASLLQRSMYVLQQVTQEIINHLKDAIILIVSGRLLQILHGSTISTIRNLGLKMISHRNIMYIIITIYVWELADFEDLSCYKLIIAECITNVKERTSSSASRQSPQSFISIRKTNFFLLLQEQLHLLHTSLSSSSPQPMSIRETR
jgi:hypothetical protein